MAVVYAVMVETGLNRQELGMLILAACFVTDLGTVLALGGFFADFGPALIVFVVVSAVTLALFPRLSRLVIRTMGHRVSEPEIKLLLLALFGLSALAAAAGSEAVLTAYVAGLVVAGVLHGDRVLIDRMRSIAFALLTPFFFRRAGLLISWPALVSGAGVIALLLGVKLVAKVVGVWPVTTGFRIERRERTYITLLMGYRPNLWFHLRPVRPDSQPDRPIPVLAACPSVILSAFVPTLIAQRLSNRESSMWKKRKLSARRTLLSFTAPSRAATPRYHGG